jgi:DNA-directed RNA polymerase subunit RPC12/RpoP
MLCPECGHRLLKKSDAKLKLRVPIIVFDDDGANAVTNCPGCKQEIRVPVTLEKSAIPDEPNLVLAKGRLTHSAGDP